MKSFTPRRPEDKGSCQEGLGDTTVRREDTGGKCLGDEDLRIKKVLEMKT
jgi:hypothetical protein